MNAALQSPAPSQQLQLEFPPARAGTSPESAPLEAHVHPLSTFEVFRFVADSRLMPVVDSVLPLAQARRAHERIEAREHFGKLVLVP